MKLCVLSGVGGLDGDGDIYRPDNEALCFVRSGRVGRGRGYLPTRQRSSVFCQEWEGWKGTETSTDQTTKLCVLSGVGGLEGDGVIYRPDNEALCFVRSGRVGRGRRHLPTRQRSSVFCQEWEGWKGTESSTDQTTKLCVLSGVGGLEGDGDIYRPDNEALCFVRSGRVGRGRRHLPTRQRSSVFCQEWEGWKGTGTSTDQTTKLCVLSGVGGLEGDGDIYRPDNEALCFVRSGRVGWGRGHLPTRQRSSVFCQEWEGWKGTESSTDQTTKLCVLSGVGGLDGDGDIYRPDNEALCFVRSGRVGRGRGHLPTRQRSSVFCQEWEGWMGTGTSTDQTTKLCVLSGVGGLEGDGDIYRPDNEALCFVRSGRVGRGRGHLPTRQRSSVFCQEWEGWTGTGTSTDQTTKLCVLSGVGGLDGDGDIYRPDNEALCFVRSGRVGRGRGHLPTRQRSSVFCQEWEGWKGTETSTDQTTKLCVLSGVGGLEGDGVIYRPDNEALCFVRSGRVGRGRGHLPTRQRSSVFCQEWEGWKGTETSTDQTTKLCVLSGVGGLEGDGDIYRPDNEALCFVRSGRVGRGRSHLPTRQRSSVFCQEWEGWTGTESSTDQTTKLCVLSGVGGLEGDGDIYRPDNEALCFVRSGRVGRGRRHLPTRQRSSVFCQEWEGWKGTETSTDQTTKLCVLSGVGGLEGDGDIYRPDNLKSFQQFVFENTNDKGVHFVMADGVSYRRCKLRVINAIDVFVMYII